jgi:hypothetical protein
MIFLGKDKKTSKLALVFKDQSTNEIHKILRDAQSAKGSKERLKSKVSPSTKTSVDKGELVGTFRP